MSTPQQGQHHNLYQIQELFNEISNLLKQTGLDLNGLFLNADSGFDSENFRQVRQAEGIFPNVKANPRNNSKTKYEPCQSGTHIFDEQLYKDRSVIEHSNVWIDGFKALLVRFEF